MPPEMDDPLKPSSHMVAAVSASTPTTTDLGSTADSSIDWTEADGKGDVEQRRQELESRRKQIGLLRHPFVTLRYFCKYAGGWIGVSLRMLAGHPLFGSVLVPGAIMWRILKSIPGPHLDIVNTIEHSVKFVVWWVGLGILSSVGVGSGINSGFLFLFPHLVKICLTVEACNSVDFKSSGNMWFSNTEGLFECPSEAGLPEAEALPEGDDGLLSLPVTYLQTLLKVYPACFFWGVGTAIGEIPPYALSRAAAETGEQLADGDELKELEQQQRDATVGAFDLVTRAKLWMIAFLKQQGFLGVFFLSAIPNMAFDLCGMCCGHFGMPFWEFFGGILLGKAGVRVLIQASFFAMLFNSDHLESFIALVNQATPASWNIGVILHNALVEGKAKLNSSPGSREESGGGFLARMGLGFGLKTIWTMGTIVLLVLFVVTAIDQIARRSAQEEDEERLRALSDTERRRNGHGRPREGATDVKDVKDAKGDSSGETGVDVDAVADARPDTGSGPEGHGDTDGTDGIILDISSPSSCLATHKAALRANDLHSPQDAHKMGKKDGAMTPTKVVAVSDARCSSVVKDDAIEGVEGPRRAAGFPTR